jgi:hypothetical protein
MKEKLYSIAQKTLSRAPLNTGNKYCKDDNFASEFQMENPRMSHTSFLPNCNSSSGQEELLSTTVVSGDACLFFENIIPL